MKRKLNLALIAILPAALGFIAWQVYRNGLLTDSIIYLRASLGLLLFVIGIILTILIGAVVASFINRASSIFTETGSRTQESIDDVTSRTRQSG